MNPRSAPMRACQPESDLKRDMRWHVVAYFYIGQAPGTARA